LVDMNQRVKKPRLSSVWPWMAASAILASVGL